MIKLGVSRELGVVIFLVAVIFTVVSTFSLLQYRTQPDSGQLRREILELSEKYVWTLLREGGELSPGITHGEGPRSGARFTQHDLSRTIAVVLEDVLTRLEHLEHLVRNKTKCLEQSELPNQPKTEELNGENPPR